MFKKFVRMEVSMTFAMFTVVTEVTLVVTVLNLVVN